MFQSVAEEKTYVARPVDSKGNAASVDGAPAWALTDPSLAELKPSDDGLSCLVIPSGAIGICKLQVVGDADMSADGRKEIFGEADLEFIAAEAVRFELSAQ